MKDIILCAICGKECNGQVTGGHLKTHGTNTREYELKYGSAKTELFSARARVWAAKGGSKSSGGAKQREAAALRKTVYLTNPNRCKVCSAIIAYEKSNQNKHFCGSSCAAKHNNTKRERKYHCLSCATPLNRKGKYCNQVCQYEVARQDRYKLWKPERIEVGQMFVSVHPSVRSFLPKIITSVRYAIGANSIPKLAPALCMLIT